MKHLTAKADGNALPDNRLPTRTKAVRALRLSLAALSLVAVVGAALSCGDRSVSPSRTGRIILEVSYAQEPAAKPSEVAGADRMVATVLDGTRVLMVRDLRHEGARWRGEIEVVFGTYTVVLEAYIGSLVKWRGQRSAVVRAGKTTQLPVQMVLENVTPTADAGSDAVVTVGATVHLDGSASSDPDGDVLSYVWRQVLGPAVELSGSQTARPSFVAAQTGDYRFALSVTDGVADSPTDGVAVTVKAPNRAPVADAGPDQSVKVGATVQLDGSASRDPDGDPLTYTWRQVLGPMVTLRNGTAARPSFVASETGEYRFAISVSDGKVDSAPDAVAVSVTAAPAAPNRAPVADAGSDQALAVGATVELDGSGSWDPDGNRLSYRWSVPTGTTLSNATLVAPTITATAAGVHRIVLVVNDGKVDSAPDTVSVTALQVTAPVEFDEVVLPGGATMDFVWIEPGTFTMGSPSSEPGRNSDEGPRHQVTISQGFWLGKCEITQGQWESVMGTTPWSGIDFVRANPNHPAVFVSWDDVQGLVQKVNQAAGERVYRLPTEAEWEYACRAGTSTRWSFGDDEGRLRDYAWYEANAWNAGLKYAQPVGGKLANPWGLHDMHGNVWEWVQDWYGAYASGAVVDPLGPSSGSYRVIRGGDFRDDAQRARAALRINCAPDSRNYGVVGARLLRMAEPVVTSIAPTANAGPDQLVMVGATVHLDGTASHDLDGDNLTYTWSQTLGPAVTLRNGRAASPSYVASEPGEYRFTLVVNDGKVNSAPDEVAITAQGAASTTGDAQVTGEVEEGTGDAQVTGDVEENTGDAQVIGEVNE